MCAYGTGREPRGAALIIAMLVMAVLLLAGTTFLTISSTETQIALNERISAQAFMVAEAGLHKAIQQLDANSSYSGETGTAFGGGTFSVAVTTVAGCTATSARSLTVTGVVPVRGGQAQSKIQAIVDQISYPFRWAAFATASSGWSLIMMSGASTNSFDSTVGAYGGTNIGSFGNVGTNGNLLVWNNAIISGNAGASGSVTVLSATVTGSRLSGIPRLTYPTVSAPAAPSGNLTIGNNVTVTFTPGTYVYDDLTMGNGAVLATSTATSATPVIIYFTGDISTMNTVVLGADSGRPSPLPTSLQIITAGSSASSIDLGNNSTIYASIYAPNANVTGFGNNTQIYGSMVASTLNVQNNDFFHYDAALFDQQVCTFGKYSIRRGTWYEVLP